jgi:hypothetical protein
MKIFNIRQASIFILSNCKVINCGYGDKKKIYIEFEENQTFKEMMTKWINKEFI